VAVDGQPYLTPAEGMPTSEYVPELKLCSQFTPVVHSENVGRRELARPCSPHCPVNQRCSPALLVTIVATPRLRFNRDAVLRRDKHSTGTRGAWSLQNTLQLTRCLEYHRPHSS